MPLVSTMKTATETDAAGPRNRADLGGDAGHDGLVRGAQTLHEVLGFLWISDPCQLGQERAQAVLRVRGLLL